MQEEITKRQAEIVRAVVRGYVVTGQPVGSAIIVEKFILDISSATVRKEMSVLEQMGYLYSPHTSAGRVPTDKAIELYVNELARLYEGSLESQDELEEFYRTANMQLEKLFKATATQLANASHNAGVVLAPMATGSVIKQVELVSITGSVVLMIMVSRNGSVFQKKIKLDNAHSQEDLYKISRFLNRTLQGYEIADIRDNGLSSYIDSSRDLGELGSSAVQVAQNLIYMPPDQQVLIEGEAVFFKRLLDEHPDTAMAERLIRMMEDRSFVGELINRLKRDNRTAVQVGIDIDGIHMPGISVLARSYSVGGRKIGALGVIGICRMPYEKIIASMGYSSEILSNVLREHNELDFNKSVQWSMDGLPIISNRNEPL